MKEKQLRFRAVWVKRIEITNMEETVEESGENKERNGSTPNTGYGRGKKTLY